MKNLQNDLIDAKTPEEVCLEIQEMIAEQQIRLQQMRKTLLLFGLIAIIINIYVARLNSGGILHYLNYLTLLVLVLTTFVNAKDLYRHHNEEKAKLKELLEF